MLFGLIIKLVYGKECLEQETDTPSPEGHGWMIEDGKKVFDLMHSECHSHVNVSFFDYDPAELAELRYNYIFHFRMSELYVCIFGST